MSYIKRLNEIIEIASEHTPNQLVGMPPKSVSYQGQEHYQFQANKITVLSGQSGSGKSSILRGLSQHSDRTTMEGELDDNVIDNIIMVNKHSTFVDGTIIDNITCFRPELHKAAYSLCETLGIKGDIDDLKQGFYTEITTTGIKPFSRKVNFALLIVRALLSNKKISALCKSFWRTSVLWLLLGLVVRKMNS